MDWGKLPDIAAVTLLTAAFASVARRGHAPFSALWQIGWVMIVLHFVAFFFLPAPGIWGTFAAIMGLSALTWAGILFMWAAVPYRHRWSSRLMLIALFTSNTAYIAVSSIVPAGNWLLTPAAILFGALPLAITLWNVRQFNHLLRWSLVALYCALSVFLLMVQDRPNGPDLALNAILFTVYLGCCIHFWYVYRRSTAGAFITIAGFVAWANVFVIAPSIGSFFPNLHLESEVWNLPKYVVAVGMILLLLEDQIEHNKYLALHDELTGLPNRRLFQDRLASALERARRTESQAALLLLDLDQFKQVNDSVGHHAGDELLRHVSRLFKGRVRRADTVARTGGDEFSVILEEPTSRADAMRVAGILTQLLETPFEFEGHSVRVGASIGIAVFPDDASTPESLCIAADVRMYAGKHESRGRTARKLPHRVQPDPLPKANPQAGVQLAE